MCEPYHPRARGVCQDWQQRFRTIVSFVRNRSVRIAELVSAVLSQGSRDGLHGGLAVSRGAKLCLALEMALLLLLIPEQVDSGVPLPADACACSWTRAAPTVTPPATADRSFSLMKREFNMSPHAPRPNDLTARSPNLVLDSGKRWCRVSNYNRGRSERSKWVCLVLV